MKASRSPGYLGSGLSQLLGYLAERPEMPGVAPRGWLVAPAAAPFSRADADPGEPLAGNLLEDPGAGDQARLGLGPAAVAEKIEVGAQAADLGPPSLSQYFVAEYFDRSRVRAVARGTRGRGGTSSMRLNYSVTPEPLLREGIQRLADAIAAMEGGGALPRRT
jgi:hypothetical protein